MLSKDLVEVNNFYKKDELNLPLISNIIDSNDEHLEWTVNQLTSLKQNNNLEKIYLVGAAFKENTDDLRNSPTLDIYKILSKMKIEVIILDQEIQVPSTCKYQVLMILPQIHLFQLCIHKKMISAVNLAIFVLKTTV